jgi:hypothetical protein
MKKAREGVLPGFTTAIRVLTGRYTVKSKRAGTHWTLMVQTQQHAQAALLTNIRLFHYRQVVRAKSTRPWAEKNR